MRFLLLFMCLLLAAMHAAHASEVNASVPVARTSLDESVAEKRLSASVETGLSSDFRNSKDTDHETSGYVSFAPSYVLGKGYTLAGLFYGEQVFKDFQTFVVKRSDLSISHQAISLNPFLGIAPSASVYLPLYEDARDRESLLFGIKVGPKLTFSLKQIGAEWISGYFSVAGRRNFHEYTVTTDGKSNSEWGIGQTFDLSLQITKKLGLDSLYNYGTNFTYGGNQRSSFFWSESLSYDVSDAWGTSVTIANTGNALKDNGIDSRIALIDPYSTTLSASVSYKF